MGACSVRLRTLQLHRPAGPCELHTQTPEWWTLPNEDERFWNGFAYTTVDVARDCRGESKEPP